VSPHKNKTRGNKAEARIVSALSDSTGEKFARSPGSGSANTWGYFAGQRVRGDLMCLSNPEFEFMVESKKTKDFPWDLLFTANPPADFVNWWTKAKDDATKDDKFAALVISRNQGPMVIFTAAVAWQGLGMDVKHANARLMFRNKQLLVTTVEQFGLAYKERSKRENRHNGHAD